MELVTAFLNAFNATLQDVIDAIRVGPFSNGYTGHNALAITDTANYDGGPLSVWQYPGRKCIEVWNGCDQAVSITLMVYDYTGVNLLYTSDAQVVAANSNSLITAAAIPALLEPLQQFVLRANYTVAPTTGTLTTVIDAAPV